MLSEEKITAFRWLSPFLSLSPPPAPFKTLATLKENSPTTCQFYIGHKDNFCWERGGKRDWSLAVPFHRQGSLWRSENTSCIKIQHTLWVQGWGAEATMYQQCPQTNGTHALTFQTGKSFSLKMCQLFCLIKHNPLSQIPEQLPLQRLGESCKSLLYFLSFLCISPSCCTVFASSSALRSSRSSWVPANGIPGLAGPACVNSAPSPCHVTSLPGDPSLHPQ